MNVVGLDLSLTATGVAWPDGRTSTLALKTKGVERLDAFYDWASNHIDSVWPDGRTTALTVIEGYSYASKNQAHQAGELGGVVRLALHHAGVPFIDVPPTTVKLYATGKGNAHKDEVLAAAIRAGCHDSVTTNDRADAWWLRAIGLHLHGEPVAPETAYRDKALAKLREAER